MVFDIAVGLMLLTAVGALVSLHRNGWLADFLLRSSGSYARSSSLSSRNRGRDQGSGLSSQRSVGIKAQ
ncbi:hypothetical protein BH23CHL2_BH23CHL2_03040 [soil metagenome]